MSRKLAGAEAYDYALASTQELSDQMFDYLSEGKIHYLKEFLVTRLGGTINDYEDLDIVALEIERVIRTVFQAQILHLRKELRHDSRKSIGA